MNFKRLDLVFLRSPAFPFYRGKISVDQIQASDLKLSEKKETYLVLDGYYYTKDHEWVRRKGGDIVLIGITDYAAKMLHDIVYVSLPQEGTKFQEKDVLGQVESVKTVADVYMPISGTIIKVNQNLAMQPELVSDSPYEQGWMVEVMATSFDSESNKLLNPTQYNGYVQELQSAES